MKILYLSLFPEKNQCNEIQNLKYFMDSSIYYNIRDIFSYRLFSCYEQMSLVLRDMFLCNTYSQEALFNFDNETQVERLFFDIVYNSDMDNKDVYELAWAKQKIFSFMTFKKVYESFDYILYTDPSIKLDSKDIYELCQVLKAKNKEQPHFINIPHVDTIQKKVIQDSFESYILPTYLIPSITYMEKSLYELVQKDGKLSVNKPSDWILRQQLLVDGYVEVRGESCNTRHYFNPNQYYEFDANKLTAY